MILAKDKAVLKQKLKRVKAAKIKQTKFLRQVNSKEDESTDSNGLKFKFFKCMDCNNIYNNSSGLSDHRNALHSAKVTLPCAYCGIPFQDVGSLQKHTIGNHLSEESCLSEENTNNQRSLALMLEKPTGSKRALTAEKVNVDMLICGVCGNNFDSDQHLKAHIETCHTVESNENGKDKNRHSQGKSPETDQTEGDNDVALICGECNKSFAGEEEFNIHVTNCSIENEMGRTYSCNECVATFLFLQ